MSGENRTCALRGEQRRKVAAGLAARFRRGGVSIRELAVHVNRRPDTVQRLLVEAGIHFEEMPRDDSSEVEVQQALAHRYRGGTPIGLLAQEAGMAERKLRRLLAEAGAPVRHEPACPPERASDLVRWYQRGVSIRKAADKAGCSYGTARTSLLDAGVVLRGRGRGGTAASAWE